MPTWGKILKEINELVKAKDPHALDTIRNKYLEALHKYTRRNVIIYASRWATGDAPANMITINDEDVQALMNAIAGLKGKKLDLILHTSGGSAEATDAIVSYLRQKFDDIRIIIPQAALSAGTMLACSGNTIVMGKQSSIGPIDPQFILQTQVGVQAVPAHAILEQFKLAQEDCVKNPANLKSWMPLLSQYGPALLVRCKDQIKFGQELVEGWLRDYMFKGEKTDLPSTIAEYLSNHANFNTHGKHLNIIKAKEIGLKIEELEAKQKFQERVLSAFHATVHAFAAGSSAKIIANHKGNCFVKHFQQIQKVPMPIKRISK